MNVNLPGRCGTVLVVRWVKGVLVALALLAPIGAVVLVAWPSSGADEEDVREEGSGPDGALLAGDQVGGTLGFGEVASYRAVGTGDELTFSATSQADLTLTVVAADGSQLAFNDDTDGLNPEVAVDPDEGEEVTVEVRELNGQPIGFTLTVEG